MVVNPKKFGSYENVAFATALVGRGAKLDIADKQQHSPLYYAYLQESGIMSAALLNLGARDEFADQSKRPARASSVISEWSELLMDVEADAQQYVNAAQQQHDAAERPAGYKHTVDKNSYLVKSGEIYVDADGVVYDVVFTKVDAQYGTYGRNNFYKMQLIYQPTKNLYFMFTRWGRIGEDGQYQHTPFATVDEATTEYAKLFRSKTGNLWANHPVHLHFERKPKKWNLVHIDYAKIDYRRLLRPFEWELYPKSRLPALVQSMLKHVTDVKLLHTSLQTSGIDTDLLPLGQLSSETINKARNVLQQIKESLELSKELSTVIPVDAVKMQAEAEKVAVLTNHFYELIPHKNFAVEDFEPFSQPAQLMKKITLLSDLADIGL
jgi:hypothetical protein